jgi:hypothetical protein
MRREIKEGEEQKSIGATSLVHRQHMSRHR